MFTRKIVFKTLGALIAVAVLLALLPGSHTIAQSSETIPVYMLKPSWNAPGSGGVWASYRAWNGAYESPGLTQVYQGREAGVIKAGLIHPYEDPVPEDPDYNWDQGLIGFMTDITINDLATGPFSFDVINEAGVNPVWMNIEIDTGTVGDRNDNTIFQHIPTSNPSEWHTVDAAAGQWQKWTDFTSGETIGPLMSLSEIAADSAYGGLNVVRVMLRVGIGPSYWNGGTGTIGWVDKVVIGSTTYDFRLQPDEVFVDDDPTCDGNSPCFASIQDGIDAVAEGGKVHVYPGTYEEALLLNKKGITVQSTDGADVTIIDVPFGTLTTGVKVLANMGTVTFDGFSVINVTEQGIVQGMGAREGTTFHVLNNVVGPYNSYLRNGIQVSGDGSTVIGNTVHGARLTEDWLSSGIIVVNASDVIVQNNTVIGGAKGVDIGITVYAYSNDVSSITIEGNTISDAYWNGIQLQGLGGGNYSISDITIISNIIRDSGESIVGGWMDELRDVVIEKNQFEQTWDAIWIRDDVNKVTNFDASPNWWGSITGPDLEKTWPDIYLRNETVAPEVYTPWCGDPYCTFLVPDDAIVLSGTITETIKPTKGQTVLLADGTKIDTDGACFEIEADHVTIMTESPLGAVCYPGSPGIEVSDGAVNIIIEGLEIDGTDASTGHGIEFLGDVTDVIIRDTFIHAMKGDGVHFTKQPAGYVELKGNLFMGNTGFGVNAPADLDVKYNAWGAYGGPTAGDGVSANITSFAPWTHVDVFMEYVDSTRYDDEVALEDETIKYEVKANLQQAFGAEFTLTFDPAHLAVKTVTNGTVFTWGLTPITYDNVAGTITFNAASLTQKTGQNQTLYTVEFEPVATTSADNPLEIPGQQGVSLFGMNPGYGASLNIYPVLLDGVKDVNVYKLPIFGPPDPLEGYYVGNPKEFTLPITNPADGRDYDNAKVCLDVPSGAVLEYWDGTAWVPYDPDTCLVIGELKAGQDEEIEFRITFPAAGDPVIVPGELKDGDTSLVKEDFEFKVYGSHEFTGAVQMQGRTVRAGVLVKLDSTDYKYQMLSTAPISGNFSFMDVASGNYLISFIHDRYLSLIDYEVDIFADFLNWGRFELKGGDLDNNQKIEVFDASIVATDYGKIGDFGGDANFDGKVNIQDLAMVAGNYGLQSLDPDGADYAYPTVPTWGP